MTKAEMRKLNLSIIGKAFAKATMGVDRKYHFTATNDFGYEHIFTTKNRYCYVMVEVDCDIRVAVIITTLNYNDRDKYLYFQYCEDEELDVAEYTDCTSRLFEYLFTEGLNMPLAPEWRKQMLPSNATKEEMAMLGCEWYSVWEHRMAQKHSFHDTALLKDWLDRCTGAETDNERYSFDSHWNKAHTNYESEDEKHEC